jgi:hypothetical protein
MQGNAIRAGFVAPLLSLLVTLAVDSASAQVVVQGTPAPPPPTVITVQGQAVPTTATEVRNRPVIERIEPTSGPGGTVVTIVGRNFNTGDQVFYGGAALAVQSVVPTRITVAVPIGARSGRFTVQGPAGTAESSQSFNVVLPPPPPVLTGFAPVAGVPGTDVALEGTGFSLRIYENRVSLNGLILPVRTASTTRLTVTIPEGAADGPFVIEVANAGAAQSAGLFDVLAPLRIDRIEPVLGPVGSVVRILGTGFEGSIDGNTVRLGDRRCTVRSASPTELSVEVPARALTGSFVVAVRNRGELATPEFRVVYPPVLRSFLPRAGFPGTEVAIKGTGFGTSLALVQASMSGVALTVSAVTDTEVRVRIPENAGTGVIQVTVQDAGTVVTPQPFEVWLAPAITSFSPTRANPGTVVTVIGRGFLTGRGQTTVAANGVSATVQSISDGQLTFAVPSGATTGRIVVTVRGRGEAQAATDLTVVQPPHVSSVSPRSAAPGDSLTLSGDGFGSTIADVTVTYIDDVATGVAQTLELRSLSTTQIVVGAPSGTKNGRLTVSIRNVGEASTSYRPGRPVVQAQPATVVPSTTVAPVPVPVVPAIPLVPTPPPPTVIR